MGQELGVRSLGIGGREYYTDVLGPYVIAAADDNHKATSPHVKGFLCHNATGSGTCTPTFKPENSTSEAHTNIASGNWEIFTFSDEVGCSNGTLTVYELF